MTLTQHKPLTNKQLLMLIVLASFGMLFGTFILSLMFARLRAPVWPPRGILPLDPWLPTLSTAAIVVSSILIHKAHAKFVEKRLEDFRYFWGLGLLLGILFMGLQSWALGSWYMEGVRVSQHLYASAVYVLIIFHGLHLSAGLAGLVHQYFYAKEESSLQAWSWFWHFLGVVWIIMFPLLLF
jgi:heme/copper-type cytochrome/quinol oxidase subunit 3